MSSQKKYTFSEVAKHNSPGDCWVIIGDKVYDVSKFLEEHPGGEAALLEQTGKYATNAFEDVGHSTDARQMLNDYLIGEVIEKEPKSNLNPYAAADNNSNSGTGSLGLLIPIGILIGAFVFYKYYYNK